MSDPAERKDIKNVFQPGSGDLIQRDLCCKKTTETWDINEHIYDFNEEYWDQVYFIYTKY